MHKLFFTVALVAAALLPLAMIAGAEEAALTVEALEEQGHQPLDEDALREFIVGKALTIRNLTTDAVYEGTYFTDGFRLLRSLRDASTEGGLVTEGIAPYEISGGKLVTVFQGSYFDTRIYDVDGRRLAAQLSEGGAVNWELLGSRALSGQQMLTVPALRQGGVEALGEEDLRRIVVGRNLIIKHRETGEKYEAAFRADGQRELRNVTKGRSPQGSDDSDELASYEITGDQVVTTFGGRIFRIRVYLVEGTHLAARSSEGTAVNWEIISSR